MRRPHSSSSFSLVTIFSLVLVTLSLTSFSFSSIHVHAQSLDCSQLDAISLRALNGTNGTAYNNITVIGINVDPVTSPVFLNLTSVSVHIVALSSFIGRAYNCSNLTSTFYESNLRLNNAQYNNFTQHITNAVASAGYSISVLSSYFASFSRGAAFPICNSTDCPVASTATAAPTTPAPTVSVNTTNAPNTTTAPTTAPTTNGTTNVTTAPPTTTPTPTPTSGPTNATNVTTTTSPPTTVTNTTSAPTNVTTTTTAPPTTITNTTNAPTNVTTTTTAPPTTITNTTAAPTNATTTTATPTSTPTPTPTSTPAPTTSAPTLFPPQRCFNETSFEDRNTSTTYPTITYVDNWVNFTVPVMINFTSEQPCQKNETVEAKNITLFNITLQPRQVLYQLVNISLLEKILLSSNATNVTFTNVTVQTPFIVERYVTQDNVTCNATTTLGNVTVNGTTTTSPPTTITNTTSAPTNGTTNGTTTTTTSSCELRNVTGGYNTSILHNVSYVVYDSVPTIIGYNISNATTVLRNGVCNETKLQQKFEWVNQTFYHWVNRTFPNNETTTLNNTSIGTNGTTNGTVANTSTPVNVTREVYVPYLKEVWTAVNTTELRNVPVPVIGSVTNYTIVSTPVDKLKCVNQSCAVQYYNESRPSISVLVTSINRTREVPVIGLQPIYAEVTTISNQLVSSNVLSNVTRNFTILQETLIDVYDFVPISNTTNISTPYIRTENVTETRFNTSITNYTITERNQTGGFTNTTWTYNITTYTPVTTLQNVTYVETRPVLRNVTVTRVNVSRVNITVNVPTVVLVPTTVLRNVTYVANATGEDNVTITNFGWELRYNGTFTNLTGYNLTTYNETLYGWVNITNVVNATYNETKLTNVTTGWKWTNISEPIYNYNATRMDNFTITNTTTQLQNRTRERNITGEFNITTFEPTTVNVWEIRTIDVATIYNDTILQNVTVPFPVTREENVTVYTPSGYTIITNYTLEPVYSMVNRTISNTTSIPYTVTVPKNVTYPNITTVTTNGTVWALTKRSIIQPVLVQRTVPVLVQQNITIQVQQTQNVIIGYTTINTTQTTIVPELNVTAVLTQATYNASRIVCNDTTPPPTIAPTTPAPTTPPPNVTVAICTVEDVPVVVNISTPGWELRNDTFTNNYTVEVIRPVNTFFPNETTIYTMTNVTRVMNGTTNSTSFEWKNVTFVANTTVVTEIFEWVNVSTTTNKSELRNLTRPAFDNVITGYTNVTVYVERNVTVPVVRTFRIPVINNVTTITVQEPIFVNEIEEYNTTEFVNQTALENVTYSVPNITYTMINTPKSIAIYNGTNTTILTNVTTLKNVTRLRNVTELVPITGFQNVTVPERTITVPITVPGAIRTENVTYPNGTSSLVNVTSDNVTVLVDVIIPSFVTRVNITTYEIFNTTTNTTVLNYVTVERNTTELENVTQLTNVSTPIEIGTNITWSLVNTTVIGTNITFTKEENRTHLVNGTVLRTRIVPKFNGTRSVNVTRLVDGFNGTITTWSLVNSFNIVNETVNVTTTVNVPAGVGLLPIITQVVREVNETYIGNVTVFNTTSTTVNRTTGLFNTTVTYFNKTELRNVSVTKTVPTTFNQTKLENQTTIIKLPYFAFVNTTVNETRVNTTWAWVNHTITIITPTITGYVPTTVCRNFTGLPGTILYSSGVAVNPTDVFCTKLAGSTNGTRQWNAVKNIIRWSFQGINVTGFGSVNFPGWLNHPSISPYFRAQYIYDPPYTSPFSDVDPNNPNGPKSNIDFTHSLYVDEYATLMEHFIQYFGESWGCQGQKGTRFPFYQGNPRMDVIHSGMGINYATYKIFYNQLVKALVARGTSDDDIQNFIIPYFEAGQFLRGGSLAICTQQDCPCAPGTHLCSGQCLPRCPVLATDPICIKLSKLNTPFGLTDTTSSFAALQSVAKLAFRGSNGVVKNGVTVDGLLSNGAPTAPLYNLNGGRNLSLATSSSVLDTLVDNYVRFLGPMLGCNSNRLDGNFSVYQGRPIGTVHGALNINLNTYTYWFTQVERSLRFYGVPQADIDAIHTGFFNTFARGSAVAICTAQDCPCASGYVVNGTECTLPTTAAPPTSAPTKGQPTLVPTLAPTPTPSFNTTTAPTTTPTPTTSSPTTTATPTTTASPTTPSNTTTAPTSTPTPIVQAASSIQVSIVALVTLAVATVGAMQL